MQAGLFIKILVLKSERLMRILVNPLILFQTTPSGVFAVPKQIAVDIGHLARDADWVGALDQVAGFVVSLAAVEYGKQRSSKSRFLDDFAVNLLANLSEVADLVRLTAFLNK